MRDLRSVSISFLHRLAIAILALSAYTGPLSAQPISIPNASFESPVTAFASPAMESWQKTAKPSWYNESGGYPWDQLTGLFLNTSPTNSDHIDNMDGGQALFLFAVPQVGVFQDYDSTDSTNSIPTHAFNAQFEVGKSYTLTVGLIGGGGNMTNGVTLQLSLYYRDASSNLVTVAATNVTYTPTAFPSRTHFTDVAVNSHAVKPADPWAGQHIGVSLLSTVDPSLAGGYWDLDNVRLVATSSTAILQNPAWSNGRFQFTLQSTPASRFEILATTNLALPSTNWTSLGILTNLTGSVPFTDTNANLGSRFYQARQVP